MSRDGFVDLHSHVLPGVDDGARGLPDALSMLAALRELGFSVVCATPHQKAGTFTADRAQIAAALGDVRRAVAVDLPGLEVRLGAENYWDEWFYDRSRDLSLPAYDGGRAFLVEVTPGAAPPHLEDHLFQLRLRGLLPVLAHPERYRDLMKDEARLERVARTAALVVDLAALGELLGAGPARRLVSSGLCHAVASDIHTASDKSMIARGIAWIEKKLGARTLERLLVHNPRRILEGELPD
ncbi:MAG TPA: CpsB/CapC family capsule biosynthesis tyrosine phosphatase [Polyangia bacterium]|jgi:protein-tyrosine phosphatase